MLNVSLMFSLNIFAQYFIFRLVIIYAKSWKEIYSLIDRPASYPPSCFDGRPLRSKVSILRFASECERSFRETPFAITTEFPRSHGNAFLSLSCFSPGGASTRFTVLHRASMRFLIVSAGFCAGERESVNTSVTKAAKEGFTSLPRAQKDFPLLSSFFFPPRGFKMEGKRNTGRGRIYSIIGADELADMRLSCRDIRSIRCIIHSPTKMERSASRGVAPRSPCRMASAVYPTLQSWEVPGETRRVWSRPRAK